MHKSKFTQIIFSIFSRFFFNQINELFLSNNKKKELFFHKFFFFILPLFYSFNQAKWEKTKISYISMLFIPSSFFMLSHFYPPNNNGHSGCTMHSQLHISYLMIHIQRIGFLVRPTFVALVQCNLFFGCCLGGTVGLRF